MIPIVWETWKITELGHREVEESTICARQRVDGAVTPHVLSCEDGLCNFNRAGDTVGVCWPQCCRSTKSSPEFLQGTFWLVMQVDDRAATVEVPNSHEVVSSRKNFFVLDRSTWSQDVKTSQENKNHQNTRYQE